MPLKLNIGLSKKVGLPAYSSLGASCHVEVELDSTLLHTDLEGFHRHVRGAFIACRQAVNDELAREHTDEPGRSPDDDGSRSQNANGYVGNGHDNGNALGSRQRQGNVRKATANQVRAIECIADRLQIDLTKWLDERYALRFPAELSITDASATIDELKAMANSSENGGR